ncbi:MAG: shikimate kinase [Gammaproteobacteria bacterium]
MLRAVVARPVSIILVGPMGCGKTAVGRAVARLLSRDFFDTDRYVEERTGVDISFIFEKEGEAGFRRRESEAIKHFSRQSEIVLATGGGAILGEENRAALMAAGFVVYLKASVDSQYDRTRQSKSRPLLEKGDLRETIEHLMQQRAPLYESVADMAVNTDGRRVIQVAKDIVRQLHKEGMTTARA